jgi:hypothetical protein
MCAGFVSLTEAAQLSANRTQTAHLDASERGAVTARLLHLQAMSIALALPESRAGIERLRQCLEGAPTHAEALHGINNLMALMKSEMEKRQSFMIEPDKTRFYIAERFGFERPKLDNALASNGRPPPLPLFGDAVEAAFPSARMDIVEAGRCLALGRNNGAVYHLMCAAEIGLRTLAWDRRVIVRHNKRDVPLEFAQWGELINKIEPEVAAIKNWQSRSLSAEALQFYNRALVEVRAFNSGWRTHVMHARGHAYKADETIALFGHVQRFMQTLAEKLSETRRMPKVWRKTQAS